MASSIDTPANYGGASQAAKRLLAHSSARRTNLLLIRIFDLTLLFLALPCLLPIFMLVAFLIKVDSAGPVFFTQNRIGSRLKRVDGEWVWEITTFKIYKFRSMFDRADEGVHEAHIRAYVRGNLSEAAGSNAAFKIQKDPRITRVGRWLRKTSIDELPQLWNVARGDMSLVGPRPVPTYEVAEYSDWHYERLACLPGLTGLWQVSGRGRVTFDEMIRMDIDYVRRQSLWFNIKILVLTIPAIIRGKGAL